MSKPDEKDIRETVKEEQRQRGDVPDTDKDFDRAGHQARNDYQRSGEPFGPLGDRDISQKQDVPDKR